MSKREVTQDTFQKVTGRLARQMQQWGVDRPAEKAAEVARPAVRQTNARLASAPPDPPRMAEDDSVEVATEQTSVEVDTALVEGFEREVAEITRSRGSGGGRLTFSFSDSPSVRAAFDELRRARRGR